MPLKNKKVKVAINSRKMLPKYSEEELASIAATVGLTLQQLREIHRAAHATYQEIGADMAECNGGKCMSRYETVEVVLDAGRIEVFGWDGRHNVLSPELKEWLRHKSMTYTLDQVYAAVAAGFPYAEYE